MQVIGVVGRSGCGKDELADYLSDRYGMEGFSIGRLVAQLAEKRGLHPNRKNLHQVSAQVIEEKGADFFARTVIEAVDASGCEKAVIAGVRTPEDVGALRDHYPQFLLVNVTIGDQRARFARISERAAERDPRGFAMFLEQDMEEEELFHIGDTVNLADVTIRNVGTLAQLDAEIDLRIGSRLGLLPASHQGLP